MQETLLIQRCRDGDRAAQRWLFDKYYNYVYTVSHRYVQHHQDAEDVVSEVFRRVFSNLDKVKNTADKGLKRWIQTISINESIRFINQKQPVDYTSEHHFFEGSTVASDAGSPADIKSIKQAVNTMPIGYRTIFLMNVVEGLSHTEIAEHLGISRNTSKSQMLKARKYLQNKLNDNARQLGR